MNDSCDGKTLPSAPFVSTGHGTLGWAVLAVILITLPNFCAIFLPGHGSDAAMVALHVAALLLIPCVLGASLRPVLLIGIPFVILGPVAIFCRLTTGQQPSEWFFLLIAETNPSEAADFLAPVVGGCVLLAVSGALFAWIVWKKIGRGSRLNPLGRWVVAVCALLVPAADMGRLGIGWGCSAEAGRLEKSYPLGTVAGLFRAAEQRWQINDHSKAMAGMTVRHDNTAAGQREIYLLVLGETARYDRFQINGCDRPTTPRLAGIDGLLSFHDVITPAPATVLAVPMLLTAATATEAREAMKMPSLPAVFRAAGFQVHWLTNQPRHGKWDTTASTFAQDASEARFLGCQLGSAEHTHETALDTELVTHAREVLAKGEPKVLLVLHTMGSHGLYSDRYPAQFNRFSADPQICAGARARLLEGNFTEDQKTALRNAYDNTILFTDSVLADLIGLLEAQHAVSAFYYISDHGENGAEASYLPFGHGTLTPEVLHVPLFVWLSPEYRSVRGRQCAALEEHTRARISGTTTFHTLLDLAGLNCPPFQRARSIASPEFQPGPRLVTSLHGELKDYDRDLSPGGNGRRPGRLVTSRDATAADAR